MNRLTITRPDDWHLHLRDGPALAAVLAHTASQFRRAIVMPNLDPPITTTDQALAYRKRIIEALPHDLDFTPLMTLYLTERTSAEEIRRAHESRLIAAVKLYPAGATTHSEAGVTDIRHVDRALETMADAGLPLLVHGEVTDSDVDVFDRERVFIDRILVRLVDRLPELKIVFEHITTRDAVEFVRSTRDELAATITPQHLLLNRNALFSGGLRPHNYCVPLLKREDDRAALLNAATSGEKKFFLGTDSAPHSRAAKQAACGCAGVYSAHAALAFYAEAFEAADAMDKLEGFASFFGADFYGMARNRDSITLLREPWRVPSEYPFTDEPLIPFRAGDELRWRLASR